MFKKNKIIIAIFSALVLVGVISGVYWYWGQDALLFNQIKNRTDLVELWNRVRIMEDKITQKPGEASYYMELGLLWKSLGELSERTVFFERSLSAYEQGIKKFGQQNILFYLNAGNVAERLKDFVRAEKYFKKAIEISPADESGYIELTDLYSYKMSKSKMEVVAVYEAGMKVMMNPVTLIYARGSYLRRIGDYENALVDYQILSQNYPDHVGYKAIVAELNDLIKKAQ